MIGFIRNQQSSTVAPVQGQCSGMDTESVFQSKGITPDNPGSWETYRTAPVVESVRIFDEAEADALDLLATEREMTIPSTRKGYRALKRLTKADTKVNAAHEGYRRCEAGEETQRQRVKGASARYLQGLRPAYATLGKNYTNATQLAEKRISQLMGA